MLQSGQGMVSSSSLSPGSPASDMSRLGDGLHPVYLPHECTRLASLEAPHLGDLPPYYVLCTKSGFTVSPERCHTLHSAVSCPAAVSC